MDFVKDRNPTPLYTAAELDLFPDFVKEAAQVSPEDVENLVPAAFADQRRREFPIHTKVATWLSAAYALGSGVTDDSILERIKSACTLYGISAEFEQIQTKMASQVKEAAAEEIPYALRVEVEDSPQVFYPIDSPDNIIESSMAMLKDADQKTLPLNLLRQAAIATVKAATSAGIEEDLHPRLRALGTERLPDFDHALVCIGLRKGAGITEEEAGLYREILEQAKADPDQMDRFVDLWTGLDESCGIKYSSLLPDPYNSFYHGEVVLEIEKAASANVIIQDVLVPCMVVAGFSPEIVRQNFRKEAAALIIDAQAKASVNAADASEIFESISEPERREYLRLLVA